MHINCKICNKPVNSGHVLCPDCYEEMKEEIKVLKEKLINLESNNEVKYGWVCPKCGNVYSPSVNLCYICSVEAPNIVYVNGAPVFVNNGTTTITTSSNSTFTREEELKNYNEMLELKKRR
jgi:uncharacterized OB-fold protein